MSARDTRIDELFPDLLETDVAEGATNTATRDRRAELLATLRPATRLEGFVRRLSTFLDLGPERVRNLLREVGDVRAASWTDDQVAGVRLLHFDGGPRHATADCGLVHVGPGQRYPRHHHPGDEWSLVLAGSAVEEETGVVWEPGDIVHNAAGSTHAFRAIGDEPFVFAVVLADGIEIVETADDAR